jgi:hypothetical protein
MLNSTAYLVKKGVILGHVTSKFQELYTPLEHTAIKGSVLKQDGKLLFVQFNPIKVHSGIKYHHLHRECKCSVYVGKKVSAKAFYVTKLY